VTLCGLGSGTGQSRVATDCRVLLLEDAIPKTEPIAHFENGSEALRLVGSVDEFDENE
jgi:hypothetical protein